MLISALSNSTPKGKSQRKDQDAVLKGHSLKPIDPSEDVVLYSDCCSNTSIVLHGIIHKFTFIILS